MAACAMQRADLIRALEEGIASDRLISLTEFQQQFLPDL